MRTPANCTDLHINAPSLHSGYANAQIETIQCVRLLISFRFIEEGTHGCEYLSTRRVDFLGLKRSVGWKFAPLIT